MASFNKVILMGNLTRDPELKHTAGGTAVVELGLAVNDSFKNSAGETVEKVCFVDITAWSKQAENCAKYLEKGSSVLVEGTLQLEQWENADGDKRSKHKVNAAFVKFLSTSNKETSPKTDYTSKPKNPAPADPGEFDDDIPF